MHTEWEMPGRLGSHSLYSLLFSLSASQEGELAMVVGGLVKRARDVAWKARGREDGAWGKDKAVVNEWWAGYCQLKITGMAGVGGPVRDCENSSRLSRSNRTIDSNTETTTVSTTPSLPPLTSLYPHEASSPSLLTLLPRRATPSPRSLRSPVTRAKHAPPARTCRMVVSSSFSSSPVARSVETGGRRSKAGKVDGRRHDDSGVRLLSESLCLCPSHISGMGPTCLLLPSLFFLLPFFLVLTLEQRARPPPSPPPPWKRGRDFSRYARRHATGGGRRGTGVVAGRAEQRDKPRELAASIALIDKRVADGVHQPVQHAAAPASRTRQVFSTRSQRGGHEWVKKTPLGRELSLNTELRVIMEFYKIGGIGEWDEYKQHLPAMNAHLAAALERYKAGHVERGLFHFVPKLTSAGPGAEREAIHKWRRQRERRAAAAARIKEATDRARAARKMTSLIVEMKTRLMRPSGMLYLGYLMSPTRDTDLCPPATLPAGKRSCLYPHPADIRGYRVTQLAHQMVQMMELELWNWNHVHQQH
ncbi:hypothetical protein HU200_031043 [Digitaria exilis]|uniref:Uncharacterized protein n=1 Tax=Digitaria exilis TaxID=1010633 RepID=A0A835EQ91_9POAL|nr:hypothetical protein HU200_031043 [Digitaria exilis]